MHVSSLKTTEPNIFCQKYTVCILIYVIFILQENQIEFFYIWFTLQKRGS